MFKIWQDPPPAMQAQNQVEKVAARYTGDFGMAVTTTLVFSDEAHRESWLRMNGVLDHPDPEIAEAKELDYQRRQNDQNLIYMAPNIRESCDRVASRYLEARSLKDWAFWMAQPFQVIWKHHQEFVQGPVDDAMDAIIKELAPRLVKYLVKHEVDEDVDEFIAGANLALKGAPMPSEDSKKDGYIWGKAHPDDVISNDLPPMIKRQFIQDALNEVSHKITEEVVLHTLRKAWEAINPVNTFKAIWAAVKKHGWKLGVAAALFELFEHFLFPSILVWITGKPELLASASIPFGEIVYAIIFRILGRTPKELDKVEPEGHLDWFEKNYGPVRIATSTELKYPRKSVLLETPLVTFYVVDGKAIRDDPQFSTCINVPADGPEPFDFTDFTTGANNGRYPWVPGSEIWIDNTVPPDEQRPTMIHELHEYGHMLNGWSYDKAHDAANKHEHAVRDDPSRFRFELLSGLRRLREALA